MHIWTLPSICFLIIQICSLYYSSVHVFIFSRSQKEMFQMSIIIIINLDPLCILPNLRHIMLLNHLALPTGHSQ